MAIKKARESKSWYFDTKAEALKKLEFLKNKGKYEVVRNRTDDGRLAKGWLVKNIK